jgi:predicted Zn-dependent peptidase
MAPAVERTVVDGVPVLWANGPEPYVGALVFRAGQADETLTTAGLSHLVEHLALFTAGRRKFEVNGMVDELRTVLWASGTRDEVCGFLSDVAQALGSLQLDRLEPERRVLLTEAQSRAPHPLGLPLGCRFGNVGFGLVNAHEYGLFRCSAEEVAAWARQRFTSANAVAWLTGPPSDDFSLPLPSGSRFAPPEAMTIPGLKLPAYLQSGSGAVLLSFLTPRSTAATAAARLVGERVEVDLRTGAGLTYATGAFYSPLSDASALISLRADCLDEHASEISDRMLSALGSLVDEGPTPDELADHVSGARRAYDDPRAVAGFLDHNARDLLLGANPLSPQEIFDRVAALTSDEVAGVLRDGRPTTLLIAPERTPPPGEGFAPYETEIDHSSRVDGIGYDIKGTGGFRKAKDEIVAGEGGISFVGNQSGELMTIRRDDVVGLLSFGAGRFTILSSNGAWIDVNTPTLANGDELRENLRRWYADRIVPLEDMDAREAVEQVASRKLKRRWTVSWEIEGLPALLAPGEELVTLGEAMQGMKTGLLVVTDRRVFFVSQGRTKRRSRFLELAFDEIESVQAGEGIPALWTANVKIRAGGQLHKFTDVTPRERAPELAEAILSRTRSAPSKE